MESTMSRLFISLLALAFSAPAWAGCHAESGPHRIALLELYTSEGCSSCPPADRWLSGLDAREYGDRIVPLAFHVDYWDYIGWKDRFAAPAHAARQRMLAARTGQGFVYTPQVVFNGRDFRGWRENSRLERLLDGTSAQTPRARLLLDISEREHGIDLSATAQTDTVRDARTAQAYVAIYENDLESTVSAGENSGRRLHHDRVVREWFGPFRLDGRGQWQQRLVLKPEWKGRNGGAAVFIEDAGTGETLQALSLPFCGTRG